MDDDLRKLEVRYCLCCGETDLVYTDKFLGKRYHVVSMRYYDFIDDNPVEEPDQCFGPFASCPPPVTDPAYWDWLFSQPEQEEPDPIEIILSDFVGVE